MNYLNKNLIIAILFASTFTAKLNADCSNPLVITDINNPPVITEPTCIKFDEGITKIPWALYDAMSVPERGGENIIGVIGQNVVSVSMYAFWENSITILDLPNVITIGEQAFLGNLITILSLPMAKTIGSMAFTGNQLTELELSNIESIEALSFWDNPLKSVTLGAGFTEPTLIEADSIINRAFEDVKTSECDLILGEFVLPERDGNMWNGYTWKSITVLGINENDVPDYDIVVYPNPASDGFEIIFNDVEIAPVRIELLDVEGKKLLDIYEGLLTDNIYKVDKSLSAGSYFIKILIKDKSVIKKVVVE